MLWSCVGENPNNYYLGKSVHLSENKLLFLGGTSGIHDPCNEDNLVTTCMMLILEPHHGTLIGDHH